MEERRYAERKDRSESILGLVVYSPVIYLVVFLVSFGLHLLYPIKIAESKILLPVGVFLLAAAPLLILWSQRALSRFRKREAAGEGERSFALGPYRFTRNPTYVGLSLLTLGFALVMNSLLVLLGVLVSFHIVHLGIVKREERLLAKKYGEDYERYRSKVRPWL
ncbi:MAG: methyltransferase [bacterium]|nr:methyltransferase [bacterium]